VKVLWLAAVWPEPESSAAGVRTFQLLTALKHAEYEVEVWSPCRSNSYQERLEAAGFPTRSIPPNDERFDASISAFDPAVVFFDRFMMEEKFGWRVKGCCPAAVRILDTVDLHFLRRVRERDTVGGSGPLTLSRTSLHSDDTLRELASIFRSDLSLIISAVEIRLLQTELGVPEELVTLQRLSYPRPREPLPFPARRHYAAIGNFHHAPNLDAVRLLHSELWPEISKLHAGAEEPPELHIYGAYPTKEIMRLDGSLPGFRVKGWCENSIDTLSRYRVNLAPLRFGAGLKGKIADGWAAGTPCIATSIGAEGMTEHLPFGGFVEDDWKSFARAAARLYGDAGEWSQAQVSGARALRELFDEDVNRDQFLAAMERTLQNRELQRRRNLIGAMLWREQLRSTEFFSRWIELKNKPGPSLSTTGE